MNNATTNLPQKDQTALNLMTMIDVEHEKLLASIDGLTVEEMCSEEALGNWTVKDVLAHLTAWERRLLQRVSGKPEDGAGMGTPQYNEVTYQKNRERDWESVKRDFMKTHKQVLKLVESLNAVDIKKWWVAFRLNTYNHYKWASTLIRRWRKQRATK